MCSSGTVTRVQEQCHWGQWDRISVLPGFFSFFPSCCTVMSWRKWRLMTVMAAWGSWVKLVLTDNGCRLHDAACFFRVNLSKNYIAAIVVWILPNLQRQWILKLSFVNLQNWARRHEIAKINTHKNVTIPKSQNFVLANNSNNKVTNQGLLRQLN